MKKKCFISLFIFVVIAIPNQSIAEYVSSCQAYEDSRSLKVKNLSKIIEMSQIEQTISSESWELSKQASFEIGAAIIEILGPTSSIHNHKDLSNNFRHFCYENNTFDFPSHIKAISSLLLASRKTYKTYGPTYVDNFKSILFWTLTEAKPYEEVRQMFIEAEELITAAEN